MTRWAMFRKRLVFTFGVLLVLLVLLSMVLFGRNNRWLWPNKATARCPQYKANAISTKQMTPSTSTRNDDMNKNASEKCATKRKIKSVNTPQIASNAAPAMVAYFSFQAPFMAPRSLNATRVDCTKHCTVNNAAANQQDVPTESDKSERV